MAIIDRRGITVDGSSPSSSDMPDVALAIKLAARVASTGNLTLAGLQTIDGVALVAGNRVLAKNQADPTQNGIYVVSSSNWTRAVDFDASAEVASGVVVAVNAGSVGAQKLYQLTSVDPIVLGTTNLTFTVVSGQPGPTGATGGTGATGPTGPGYAATSTSSQTIGSSGTKTFTVQAGLAYTTGSRVRAADASLPSTNWMEGVVSSYSGTVLIFTADKSAGSGTLTNWTFSVAGQPGADGAGDVSAASSFGTDNRVLRSDGTGKGAQSSGITLDDSNNVSGIVNLTATGLVDVSGASSGQIKFPASQNASANVNTLDDYEEGTFTPVVTFGGASVGMTYISQIGRYTKIGNRVLYSYYFQLSNKGSSTGAASFTGLPFASVASAVTSGAGYVNNSTAASNVVATVNGGATAITPNYFSGGNVAALTNTDFGNSTVVALGGNYETAT